MIETTGPRFCGECGAKQVPGAMPVCFSKETGNPVHRMICSAHKCKHSGHWYANDDDKPLTLWESLAGWWMTCVDCGDRCRQFAE